MNTKREVAKFFCGFEAFHAIVNAALWLAGQTITIIGITYTPTLYMWGVIVHGIIALWLGYYAWGGSRGTEPTSSVRPPGRGIPQA